MKKTILGVSFWITMFIAIVVMSTVALAAAPMEVSDQLVDKIKGYEGFSLYPMKDSSQYSVGYGTVCDPADYPDGITYEEAEALLLGHMESFQDYVNTFVAKYDIELNQNQFDALVSMTYNLGPSWIKAETTVWSLLIDGSYTASEMASAMVAWCHSSGSVNPGLVTRRIDEAQIFLYGDYSGSGTALATVYFDGNGGERSNKIMLFPVGEPYGTMATAELEGNTFLGWFTMDGTQVTEDDVAQSTQTLYAHWMTNEVAVTEEPEEEKMFTDVDDNHWFAPYVYELVEEQVVAGYTDGTFLPNANMKTGEAIKLLMVAMGYEPQAPTDTHWASGYWDKAQEDGLLEDTDIADLEQQITRENVAIISANILGVEPVQNGGVFADSVSGYADTLYGLGIISGTLDDSGYRFFYPDKNITRAELTKIVALMMKL